MAQEMFLKIATVDGEAQAKGFENQIDILAWSWGMSNSGTTHMTGAGGGHGKALFQDISFTKYVDKASPKFMQASAKGTHFADAKLTLRKTTGDAPMDYLTFEFKKVLVSSYSTGGASGEDRITENVTLNFAEVHVKYAPQDEKGKKLADVEFKFDIPKNAEA